ncbi:MAG: S-layer homology domain-containing protein [Clostridiales bacterium]|jgi:hypothetical protein|nr:S-layer homology domain-containing protein [Clostridiales bacterium]
MINHKLVQRTISLALALAIALSVSVSRTITVFAGGGYIDLEISFRDVKTPARFTLSEDDLKGEFIFKNSNGTEYRVNTKSDMYYEVSETMPAYMKENPTPSTLWGFHTIMGVGEAGHFTIESYPTLPDGYKFVGFAENMDTGFDITEAMLDPDYFKIHGFGSDYYYIQLLVDFTDGETPQATAAPATPTIAPNPTVAPGATSAAPSSWAAAAISQAVARGLATDELNANYQSDTSRIEFCRAAIRFLEVYRNESARQIVESKGLSLQFDDAGNAPSPFSDTDDLQVVVANALGIVAGVGNGQFDPNGKLTREQAAVMLANTLKAADVDISSDTAPAFSDTPDVSSWASASVTTVYARSIMNGTGNNQFSPKSAYTHEQSLMTFNNLFSHLN